MNPDLTLGCTVHLMKYDEIMKDEEGYPLIYQVIAIHRRSKEVSLINSFGEFIGRYHQDYVIYYNSDPLFNPEEYEVGQIVTWVEYDSVYEGKIIKLMNKTVEVSDVRILLPVDYVKRLPYYKIYSDSN